ncbi:MAG TPA: cytochrome c [Allosphingosinicella sp.]|nr:cytochrome c [Allosphingosinicella sp.]
MKRALLGLSIAAIVATAACNSGGGGNAADNGSSSEQREETVSNVAQGQATPQDVEAVRRARHDHYEEMGKAMKGINGALKGGSPDVAALRRHAALIAGYGPQLLTWFPEGSGPAEGSRTRAKAEIWTDGATFRARGQAFEQASAAFNRAAQSGDLAAIRAALPALKESCSNCHERFRAPEHP